MTIIIQEYLLWIWLVLIVIQIILSLLQLAIRRRLEKLKTKQINMLWKLIERKSK